MIDPINGAGIASAAQKTKQAAETGFKIWNWWKRNRYPSFRKGSHGVVIAIKAESSAIALQIDNDFISSLKSYADSTAREEAKLQIIKLPTHHAEKIDSHEAAEKVIRKCKAKLLLWGVAKNRNIDGRENTILELNVIVLHGQIVSTLSDAFRAEIQELLPGRLLVSKENNLIEMEWNAIGVQLAANYIVATACFLSDERKSALPLLKAFLERLKGYEVGSLPEGLRSHILLLKKKVNLAIATIYMNWAVEKQLKWRKTRDNSDLQACFDFLMKSEAIVPNQYRVAALGAIYYFVVENDIRKARNILEKWSGSSDASWAFSLAFLHAFEGNLSRASHYYKIAFRRTTNSSVMLEVEEFLEWVLDQNPDKVQLHYLIGMMQFFERDELEMGKSHFRKFLSGTSPGQFVSQIKEVQRYLEPDYKKPRKLR